MNYVNTLEAVSHTLTLNSRVSAGVSVDWTIYKEGSDTAVYTFTDTLTDGAYFQTLTIDPNNITFVAGEFYQLIGQSNGDTIYNGKIYASDGVVAPSTPSNVSRDYTTETTNNDYIILE